MTDRSQTVQDAIILLCNTGGVDPSIARINMKLYREDLVKELHNAFMQKDVKMVRMWQNDIAKADEVMDALLCAHIA